jgi:antitoxin ParD1/3/4
MGKLSISLPDDIDAYVERRVEEGAYASASDFVQALIRQDRDSRPLTMDALYERLDESLASGVSTRQLPEIIAEVKARLKANGRQ